MASISSIQPRADMHAVRSYRGCITILLVDDDPTVLTILKSVLVHDGYNVITAPSALSALDLAATTVFNMLITDFQMPDMDGFTLANLLAEKRADLPVLVVSGSDESLLPLTQIIARRWHFLAKPIDHQAILRIIDSLCLGWAFTRRAYFFQHG